MVDVFFFKSRKSNLRLIDGARCLNSSSTCTQKSSDDLHSRLKRVKTKYEHGCTRVYLLYTRDTLLRRNFAVDRGSGTMMYTPLEFEKKTHVYVHVALYRINRELFGYYFINKCGNSVHNSFHRDRPTWLPLVNSKRLSVMNYCK